MNIIHIVPSIEDEASGPSYSVSALCSALTRLGHGVTLMTLGDGAPASPAFKFEHQRFPQFGRSRQLSMSPPLRRALLAAASHTDIVHNHNIWGFPPIYAAQAARKAGKVLVVSPRGTFSPIALRQSQMRKRIFWHVMERSSITSAQCLHATSIQEYEDIRAFGLKAPVAIVPNGIDLPALSDRDVTIHKKGPRRLLYLGRIHPIKGLVNLLTAWGSLASQFPDWELRLVGPDEKAHRGLLESLSQELSLSRVNFAGPAYGDHKWGEYRQSDLCIQPSFSENFGMSVAEALAAARAVVTTKGAPWAGLQKHDAGWWVDIGVEPLVECLREALASSPQELANKGSNGRHWMEQEFSWQRVGSMMADVYTWLMERSERPEWVRV